MFGCSFSNAFTAALVAVPSAPRPWVANWMVCFADAGTCLPPLEPLLLQPAAASDAAVPMATAMAAALCRFLPIWPNCLVWPDHVVIRGHLLCCQSADAAANSSADGWVSSIKWK